MSSRECPLDGRITYCTENCKYCLEEDERLPQTYAEPEYTSEQLESDPIAIEGARWDDLNYRYYMER